MGLLEMLVDSELVQIMGIVANIKCDRQGNGARGTTSCNAHQLNLVYSCGGNEVKRGPCPWSHANMVASKFRIGDCHFGITGFGGDHDALSRKY